MNRLSLDRRTQILAALVEGNSILATSRMTGAAKNTVVKLLVDAGRAAAWYQDETLRYLPCRRLQCDEIWSFCYAKRANVPERLRGTPGIGDLWTWTALCADTKLVPAWHVGARDADCAVDFMTNLAARLTRRVQLTTDGHGPYLVAVEQAFGIDIDYAMLVKIYGAPREPEVRYSPAPFVRARIKPIVGNPERRTTSTSYVERQNLTMRMGMRRFTRLTNGFSKDPQRHAHMVALHFLHYNFARIHASLRVSPAMEAGVTNHL